jgi:2-keto-4-pentenoate hydratase
VQKQLRVDQPDFGSLFADMQVGESEKISLARVLQLKIEAEVAFELSHDIDVSDPTASDVARATANVMTLLSFAHLEGASFRKLPKPDSFIG